MTNHLKITTYKIGCGYWKNSIIFLINKYGFIRAQVKDFKL